MIDPVQIATDLNTLLTAEDASVDSFPQRLALTQAERDAISRLIPVAQQIISSPKWADYINQFNEATSS